MSAGGVPRMRRREKMLLLSLAEAAVKAERTGRWSGITTALNHARDAGMAWAARPPVFRGGMLPGAWRHYEDAGRPGRTG